MTIEELQAEVAKLTTERDEWKAHSRTNEDRAKANAAAVTKATDLEAQLATANTAIETSQAEALATLRGALVTAHGIDEAAAKLLSATDSQGLLDQAAAITALRGAPAATASAPLEGTYSPPVEDEGRTFVAGLFGQP